MRPRTCEYQVRVRRTRMSSRRTPAEFPSTSSSTRLTPSWSRPPNSGRALARSARSSKQPRKQNRHGRQRTLRDPDGRSPLPDAKGGRNGLLARCRLRACGGYGGCTKCAAKSDCGSCANDCNADCGGCGDSDCGDCAPGKTTSRVAKVWVPNCVRPRNARHCLQASRQEPRLRVHQ